MTEDSVKWICETIVICTIIICVTLAVILG